MDIITAYTPELEFVAGGYFAYNAADEVVYFIEDHLDMEQGRLALLHEVSHALLGHFHYGSDYELLFMEVLAWHKTKNLAPRFGLELDDLFVRECINSYDRWLTDRASCPDCNNLCLPKSGHDFRKRKNSGKRLRMHLLYEGVMTT